MEQNNSQEQVFLTQGELAKRWRVTDSTIINWRRRGFLPYLQLPGSSKLLYPLQAVLEIEEKFSKPAKEVKDQKEHTVNKRKKPEISATTQKEWRI